MKRFNFTGRKKILQSDVNVTLLTPTDAVPRLSVSANLDDYSFSETAEVFLNAQDKTRFQRFKIGSVKSIENPSEIELSNFDDSEYLGLELKVVEKADGRLVGIANRLPTRSPDEGEQVNRHGILPVVSSDLTQYGVLWRLDISDIDAKLHIEKDLGSRDQVVRSLLFKGFILPAAMRMILDRILRNDWDAELSDPNALSTRWLLFVQQLGCRIPEELNEKVGERSEILDEEIDDWLDEAVRLLSKKIAARDKVIQDFESGVWK